MTPYEAKAVEAAEHTRVTGQSGAQSELLETIGPGLRGLTYALLDLAAAIRESRS